MTKFILEMDTCNAAFDELGMEVARILRETASKIEGLGNEGTYSQSVFDLNGNKIGRWMLEADEDEDNG